MQNIFFLVERVISQNKMENCINACKKKVVQKFSGFFFSVDHSINRKILDLFFIMKLPLHLKKAKSHFHRYR